LYKQAFYCEINGRKIFKKEYLTKKRILKKKNGKEKN